MTNIGRDHWTTREIPNSSSISELVTQLELRITQLEIRLIELEVHCANLNAKLEIKGVADV